MTKCNIFADCTVFTLLSLNEKCLFCEEYLTKLATKDNVSPSTQNQAFSAILFLYKEVLGVDVSLICQELSLTHVSIFYLLFDILHL